MQSITYGDQSDVVRSIAVQSITCGYQSDVVRSIAVQSITCGDQSFGFIGTIDRNAIDPED